jgi:DNA-binding transcriptional regulator PaaX
MSLQRHILHYVQSKKAAYIGDIVEHLRNQDDIGTIPRKVALKYTVKRAIKNLQKSGDVLTHEINGKTCARLTAAGRHKLRSLNLSGDMNLVSTAWDGRWRVVILDVPESDKEVRNALRYILKKARFACLKNSVWISPYPFEHMLETMKQDLDLGHEIMVTVTDYLDPETEEAFREAYWK